MSGYILPTGDQNEKYIKTAKSRLLLLFATPFVCLFLSSITVSFSGFSEPVVIGVSSSIDIQMSGIILPLLVNLVVLFYVIRDSVLSTLHVSQLASESLNPEAQYGKIIETFKKRERFIHVLGTGYCVVVISYCIKVAFFNESLSGTGELFAAFSFLATWFLVLQDFAPLSFLLPTGLRETVNANLNNLRRSDLMCSELPQYTLSPKRLSIQDYSIILAFLICKKSNKEAQLIKDLGSIGIAV